MPLQHLTRKRAGHLTFLLLVVLLVLVPALVESRASPEPKAKPQREIENYTDRPTSIIEGKKWEDADFIIINYDIIKNFHHEKNKKESIILNSKFDLVVIDEAHYIQNKQAQRTKLINDFALKVERL